MNGEGKLMLLFLCFILFIQAKIMLGFSGKPRNTPSPWYSAPWAHTHRCSEMWGLSCDASFTGGALLDLCSEGNAFSPQFLVFEVLICQALALGEESTIL